MRALATLVALSSTLLAQPSVTVPKIFKDSYAPSANLAPVARTKVFMQTWYHGQNVPLGTIVTQMGWRYDSAAASGTGFAHTMEIVLDNTPATFSTLSSTFTSNLSATPTTFLPLTTVNWPASPSGGLDPAIWIPGNNPFFFTGPHLLVQVDVQTETTPRTLAGFNTDSYAGNSSLAQVGSPGCAASSLGVTNTANGANVDVAFTLTGGPPNSTAAFLLGAENQTFLGANVLPLDLGFMGMVGCRLGVDPLATFSLPTDGAGMATLQGPVPVIAGFAQMMFAQCAHAGNTPLGVVTTNVAGSEVGVGGLSTYVYNWTIFNPVAQYGPYTSNRGAVVLLR